MIIWYEGGFIWGKKSPYRGAINFTNFTTRRLKNGVRLMLRLFPYKGCRIRVIVCFYFQNIITSRNTIQQYGLLNIVATFC